MVIGGTSSFQKENVSIPAALLSLVERERPKTSIRNQSLLKKRSITVDTKTPVKNGQNPISFTQSRPPSACRIILNKNVSRHVTVSTQTTIEDVHQPAFLEAY